MQVDVGYTATDLARHLDAHLIRQRIPLDEKVYTWWSYRAKDWATSNRGRRLDHIWAAPELAGKLRSIEIVTEARGWERASDHVPVIARFDLD